MKIELTQLDKPESILENSLNDSESSIKLTEDNDSSVSHGNDKFVTDSPAI